MISSKSSKFETEEAYRTERLKIRRGKCTRLKAHKTERQKILKAKSKEPINDKSRELRRYLAAKGLKISQT